MWQVLHWLRKPRAFIKGSEVVKAKRGTIYDRNGIAIAEDATSYSVYAILSKSYVSGKKIYMLKRRTLIN